MQYSTLFKVAPYIIRFRLETRLTWIAILVLLPRNIPGPTKLLKILNFLARKRRPLS